MQETNTRILVVDDEELGRNRLVRILKELQVPAEILTAEDGVIALNHIDKYRPEIIFLDIQMPEMTGFDVLFQMPKYGAKIIFATAYDEYAVKAFENNACDYLLKPFESDRVGQAYQKAIRQQLAEAALEKLQEQLADDECYLENIALKIGSRTDIVAAAEISCIVSEEHLSIVYTHEREYLCDLSLNALQQMLSPEVFFRCHRNSIVNLAHIQSIKNGEEIFVVLKNKKEISVSRRNKSDLLKRIKNKSEK